MSTTRPKIWRLGVGGVLLGMLAVVGCSAPSGEPADDVRSVEDSGPLDVDAIDDSADSNDAADLDDASASLDAGMAQR